MGSQHTVKNCRFTYLYYYYFLLYKPRELGKVFDGDDNAVQVLVIGNVESRDAIHTCFISTVRRGDILMSSDPPIDVFIYSLPHEECGRLWTFAGFDTKNVDK